MNRRSGLAAFLATLTSMLALGQTPAEAQFRSRQNQQPPAQQVPPPSQGQEKTFPLGASWSAVLLNGKSISDRRATFQVDANLRGTGFSGCNTFSAAAYPLRQQGFAVGPLALTKRACDKGMMDFERAFLLALRGAQKYDLIDGRLVIQGAAGEIRFDRAI
ncbi:MAG: META domain-containing protein [Bosea sp. (in: a-proteobacteria)]